MISPNYELEHRLKKRYGGDAVIVGIDEVGRGALAGPVCTAAVCMHVDNLLKSKIDKPCIINDSKKLSEKKRLETHEWLIPSVHSYGVGYSSVEEIDEKGIISATVSAFNRAIVQLQKQHDHRIQVLLIDGPNYLLDGLSTDCKKEAIIGGDSQILSISAASIIAKVSRDKYMTNLSNHENYQNYRWDKNKGYGTKSHRTAIQKYGPTLQHRKLFLRKILESV